MTGPVTDPAVRTAPPKRRVVPGPRAQQWMVIVLLVAAGCGFVVKGSDRPADPYIQSTGRQPITGFGEVAYRVSRVPAATRCAMLAETAKQQEQGLMNQQDLHGYDGMLFVFGGDTTTEFYMKDTPLPLSIAWFDAGGRFVSSTDMEPCLGKPACPTFKAAAPYRYALEVQKGGLDALGIGSGAVMSVGGPCA